jgi:WhiB family redox-sensing transcriptional regulator
VNKHLLDWLMLPNTRDLPPLEELLAGPSWMTGAACQGAGADEFVIGANHKPSAAVKAMCGRCEVRKECLAFALEREDLVGVWGGTTERERRGMRRVA